MTATQMANQGRFGLTAFSPDSMFCITATMLLFLFVFDDLILAKGN